MLYVYVDILGVKLVAVSAAVVSELTQMHSISAAGTVNLRYVS